MKKERKGMKKQRNEIGKPPGSLIYTGEKHGNHISIDLYKYDNEFVEKHISKDISDILKKIEQKKVNWINVNGIHDVNIIEDIGTNFNLHPLLLEDLLNTEQLPKIEEYEKYMFLTLKMLSFNTDKIEIEQEHVSIVLGKNYVLSFQEKIGDVFDIIRDRIEYSKGRIRCMGVDYLFYSLIDAIVDNYYITLDKIENHIVNIEDLISVDSSKTSLSDIIYIRKQLIFLKKAVFPLRDAIKKLIPNESKLISAEITNYLNDIHDHINHIIQEIEVQREIISGLIDLNNTNLNNKMNRVMKTLTVIATIFIPLTFVVGVYGMNFKFMPELEWKYAYPGVLLFMLISGVAMFIFMKIKKWF